MSEKKTLVGKALEWLFDKFKAGFPKLVVKLWGKVPAEIREKVTIAVHVVEIIKNWVKSDKAQKLVDAIPGDWDNEVRDFVIDFLDEYDFSSVETLLPKDSHNIATTLTSELTGLPFGQSALTTEVAYQNLKDSL